VEPLRPNYAGHEGKFVAIDIRSGEIVIADEDFHRLCDRMIAEGVNKTAAIMRVPAKDEPYYRIGV
jgi:hypothetical protein